MPPEKSQSVCTVNHALPIAAPQAETEWKTKTFFRFGKPAAGFQKASGSIQNKDFEYFLTYKSILYLWWEPNKEKTQSQTKTH